LPNHERLIPSLCEYDLVGFQSGDDAFNFSRYLTRECGLHSHDFNFVLADRTIRIDVFPVGIETSAFADLSQRSVRLPFVKRVIKSLNGRASSSRATATPISCGASSQSYLRSARAGAQMKSFGPMRRACSRLGLAEHLTPQRSNGFASMVERIYTVSRRAVSGEARRSEPQDIAVTSPRSS